MTAASALQARRARLQVHANPDVALDYMVSVSGRIPRSDQLGPVGAKVRYVPDRLILDPEAFAAYLARLAEEAAATLEATAILLLRDLSNELVPRWLEIQVTLEPEAGAEPGRQQAVLLQERQPRWDNPNLLARISHF